MSVREKIARKLHTFHTTFHWSLTHDLSQLQLHLMRKELRTGEVVHTNQSTDDVTLLALIFSPVVTYAYSEKLVTCTLYCVYMCIVV